jgi:hypothetical protein
MQNKPQDLLWPISGNNKTDLLYIALMEVASKEEVENRRLNLLYAS